MVEPSVVPSKGAPTAKTVPALLRERAYPKRGGGFVLRPVAVNFEPPMRFQALPFHLYTHTCQYQKQEENVCEKEGENYEMDLGQTF
jgi:hypothetical protein